MRPHHKIIALLTFFIASFSQCECFLIVNLKKSHDGIACRKIHTALSPAFGIEATTSRCSSMKMVLSDGLKSKIPNSLTMLRVAAIPFFMTACILQQVGVNIISN